MHDLEFIGSLPQTMSNGHEFIHAFRLLKDFFLFFTVIVNVGKAVKMLFILFLFDLNRVKFDVFHQGFWNISAKIVLKNYKNKNWKKRNFN
jgi:hypothetical protein